MMQRALLLPLFLTLLLLGGCSAFDRDWDAAANLKPSSQTDITGRWQGTWISDASGHNGGLRCLVTRLNSNTYHARYAATFGGIFHFSYEMDLIATPEQDFVKFEGQADLGSMAGGVYHYEGRANADKFLATYRCEKDHGRFNMARPQ